MKQSQNARKQRGRSATRKSSKNNNGVGNRNEPKVRGNPKQLLEKYKTQAREAKQAGDRVQAEYYYQFADHYQRILNEMGVRSNNSRSDDTQTAEGNGGDEAQSGDKQPQRRNQRQRRGRQPQEAPVEATAEEASTDSVDLTQTEQPVEVHPELDLDGTAAPEPSEDEKPRRRRAPARRRAPRQKAEDVAVDAAPPAEAPAAEAPAPDDAGDNEAA